MDESMDQIFKNEFRMAREKIAREHPVVEFGDEDKQVAGQYLKQINENGLSVEDFDRETETYTDVLVGGRQPVYWGLTLPMTVAMAKMAGRKIASGDEVLEIGPALGHTTNIIAGELGEQVKIKAMEFSLAGWSLGKAINRAKKNLEFIWADIKKVSRDNILVKDSMAAVFGVFSPINYAENRQEIKEMFAGMLGVMRPGAEAYLLQNVLPDEHDWVHGKIDQSEYGVRFEKIKDVGLGLAEVGVEVLVPEKEKVLMEGEPGSAKFTNYFWSEEAIEEVLQELGVKEKDIAWLTVGEDDLEERLAGYKPVNKLLVFRKGAK